jgi:ATP-binding cassette subfamily B protein
LQEIAVTSASALVLLDLIPALRLYKAQATLGYHHMAAETAPQFAETERAKSKKLSALRGLLPFLLPYKVLMGAAFLALILTAGVSLTLPLAVRRVVDNFGIPDDSTLDKYFAAALGIAALLALGTALRYSLVTRLGERVVADIRRAVFDRVIMMSPSFFDKILTGEVLSRITTDTTLILSVLGSSISIALRNLLIFIGGLALMFLTSVKLTGLVLLIVPAVVIPILTLGRRVRRFSKLNQDWIATSSGTASESLGAVQTVQAFTHEAQTQADFADVTEKSYLVAIQRVNTRALMTMIVIFLVFSGVVGVLWIGARDVRSDLISPGTLIQFLIYAIMVAGSVAALSEIWSELQRAAGATERLVDLLSSQDHVSDPVSPAALPANTKGKLSFQNVSFRYPMRPETQILKDISFEVEPGETVALVGPSGAGKSTIIQLLLRFFDPQNGAILFDGIHLNELTRSAFRKRMAVVPQDPIIFAASVRDNIRFGRPDATDEEVLKAAQAAAATEFINKLPQGFDTYVGERGVLLSGGQKQRIAIARAILRDAPVLLLDEATSALDAESERAVQLAVDELARDRTTLIVAHRLATVKKADRILVLDQGGVVATGTHDDLVGQGGLYARLAKLQFTDGEVIETAI